jgi:hypothetical protein
VTSREWHPDEQIQKREQSAERGVAIPKGFASILTQARYLLLVSKQRVEALDRGSVRALSDL